MKKKTLRKLAVALPLSIAAVIGVACAVQDYQGGAVFQPFASDRALQSNQVLFPDDGERTEQGLGDETDDSALWEKDREAEDASRPQQQDRADYLFQDNTPDTPSSTLAGTTTPNCIRSTFYDALSLDYDAAVLSDCTPSVTPAVQQANLADMQRVGGQVLTAEELEQLLGQQAE